MAGTLRTMRGGCLLSAHCCAVRNTRCCGPSLRRCVNIAFSGGDIRNSDKFFIMLGGVDKDNVTGMVLDALKDSALPNECHITVVMGPPRLAEIVGSRTSRYIGPANRVEIGRAGYGKAHGELRSGDWIRRDDFMGRCCLGLPAVVVAMAANQQLVASALENAGAAWGLRSRGYFSSSAGPTRTTVKRALLLIKASRAASAMTDGQGTKAVVERMEQVRVKWSETAILSDQ